MNTAVMITSLLGKCCPHSQSFINPIPVDKLIMVLSISWAVAYIAHISSTQFMWISRFKVLFLSWAVDHIAHISSIQFMWISRFKVLFLLWAVVQIAHISSTQFMWISCFKILYLSWAVVNIAHFSSRRVWEIHARSMTCGWFLPSYFCCFCYDCLAVILYLLASSTG